MKIKIKDGNSLYALFLIVFVGLTGVCFTMFLPMTPSLLALNYYFGNVIGFKLLFWIVMLNMFFFSYLHRKLEKLYNDMADKFLSIFVVENDI